MTQAITQVRTAALGPIAGGIGTSLAYRLAGLAFATVLPAAFWVALGAGIANAAGVTIASSTLVTTGAIIALFLGSVCAPIVLTSDQR